MVALQQGELLDLVNHYMLLLLNMGYAGLVLFASVFISSMSLLIRTLAQSVKSHSEHRVLNTALLCTIAALMVAISTTSAVGRVGVILWCLVAVAVAATAVTFSSKVTRGNHRGLHAPMSSFRDKF